MRIFICWSGERSKIIADALNWFLPRIINSIEPWFSPINLVPGARWSQELAKSFEETFFTIICLTSDNLDSPWIHFEAGALSKPMNNSLVIPYLFDIKPEEISGPLKQFQSKSINKKDTKSIIDKLFKLSVSRNEIKVSKEIVDESFEYHWPKYEKKIKQIYKIEKPKEEKRNPDEVLDGKLGRHHNIDIDTSSLMDNENPKFLRDVALIELSNEMQTIYDKRPDKDFPYLTPEEFLANEHHVINSLTFQDEIKKHIAVELFNKYLLHIKQITI